MSNETTQNPSEALAQEKFKPFLQLAELMSKLNGSDSYFVPKQTDDGFVFEMYGHHKMLSISEHDGYMELTGYIKPGREEAEKQKLVIGNVRGQLEFALDTFQRSSIDQVKELVGPYKNAVMNYYFSCSEFPRPIRQRLQEVEMQQQRAKRQSNGLFCRITKALFDK